MAKIKICGLKRAEDIEYANEFKPDYIGFILSPGFKRSIDRETAKMLKSLLSKDINAVGVFVNDCLENIDYFLKNGIIDTVQLHKVNEYDADYFLFDSGTGTGKEFDWSNIPQTDKPFFLAGGINKDNISRAIATVKPYCIDLSSAVETNGVKDYNKIKEIMEIMKNE